MDFNVGAFLSKSMRFQRCTASVQRILFEDESEDFKWLVQGVARLYSQESMASPILHGFRSSYSYRWRLVD